MVEELEDHDKKYEYIELEGGTHYLDTQQHRTSRPPGMTDTRYAIESWLFAPSVFPAGRLAITA